MYYVYILPIIDGENMKIGVSDGDITRILQHHKTYGIVLEDIILINCKNRKLSFKVEKYLLDNIPRHKLDNREKISKRDGSTELREVKYFEKCKSLINDIKNNILFTYQESEYIEYKFYTIYEYGSLLKEKYNIDISNQIKNISKADESKYKSIIEGESLDYTTSFIYKYNDWDISYSDRRGHHIRDILIKRSGKSIHDPVIVINGFVKKIIDYLDRNNIIGREKYSFRIKRKSFYIITEIDCDKDKLININTILSIDMNCGNCKKINLM